MESGSELLRVERAAQEQKGELNEVLYELSLFHLKQDQDVPNTNKEENEDKDPESVQEYLHPPGIKFFSGKCNCVFTEKDIKPDMGSILSHEEIPNGRMPFIDAVTETEILYDGILKDSSSRKATFLYLFKLLFLKQTEEFLSDLQTSLLLILGKLRSSNGLLPKALKIFPLGIKNLGGQVTAVLNAVKSSVPPQESKEASSGEESPTVSSEGLQDSQTSSEGPLDSLTSSEDMQEPMGTASCENLQESVGTASCEEKQESVGKMSCEKQETKGKVSEGTQEHESSSKETQEQSQETQAESSEIFSPVLNLKYVLDILKCLMVREKNLEEENRMKVRVNELDSILLFIFAISLDPLVMVSSLVPSIQQLVAFLLDMYPSDATFPFQEKVQDIVELLGIYWDDSEEGFHHQTAYYTSRRVLPLSPRGCHLRGSLSYYALMCIVVPHHVEVMDHVDLRRVSRFCIDYADAMKNTTFHEFYSVLNLMDALIIRPIREEKDKEALKDILEIMSTVHLTKKPSSLDIFNSARLESLIKEVTSEWKRLLSSPKERKKQTTLTSMFPKKRRRDDDFYEPDYGCGKSQ